MLSTGKVGYNRKISQFVIDSLQSSDTSNPQNNNSPIILDIDEQIATKYAIALQTAWRRRTAKIMVSNLKQESNCKKYRNEHPIYSNGSYIIQNCDTCLNGEYEAEIKNKISTQKYTEIERLLFEGQKRLIVTDRGDNWNQRFQAIVSMPENTELERSIKYAELYTLNHDFVSTAKNYAQTIISEFFLHQKDKSIHAKKMGGIAGGEKYLWRGILFKMATGTSGPYNGSDEAAAKAAGHDLKGSVHYYNAGIKDLHLPLMAVIDYKGFRMTAQALLPLGENSLVYGSADAGVTVHNSNEKFNQIMEKAAKSLNLRKHGVGGLGRVKELHAAVDVEGHIGLDNRCYLLDLARTFPPEAPTVTKHLNDVYGDGTIVLIKTADPNNPSNVIYTKGSVHRAYPHGHFYDILFDDGSIGHKIPSTKIQSRSLSIFWRLLRPEYVRTRGTSLVPLKQEDINPINSAVALNQKSISQEKSGMQPFHIESVDGKSSLTVSQKTKLINEANESLTSKDNRQNSGTTTNNITSTTSTTSKITQETSNSNQLNSEVVISPLSQEIFSIPPPQSSTSDLPPSNTEYYNDFDTSPIANEETKNEIIAEDSTPDYDTFDDTLPTTTNTTTTIIPNHESVPHIPLGVMRQQTLGYDDFDNDIGNENQSNFDLNLSPNPHTLDIETTGYDSFDTSITSPLVSNQIIEDKVSDNNQNKNDNTQNKNENENNDNENNGDDNNQNNNDNNKNDNNNDNNNNENNNITSTENVAPVRPGFEKKYSEGYGFFRNTIIDDSSLPPSNPELQQSSSSIRMQENSEFETKQMNEIIDVLDRYRKYDMHEDEIFVTSESTNLTPNNNNTNNNNITTTTTTTITTTITTISSSSIIGEKNEIVIKREELKKRQAYIDATVNELYSNSSNEVSEVDLNVPHTVPFRRASELNAPLSAPLSPDALTAFSNYDPEAIDRNREVIRATERLVKEVIPALARRLALMRNDELYTLDISVFFHSNGVNIRHMGLVRSHIPASQENIPVRTFLLVNIVSRTLKNISREFQRRWMKSEQSSSEQGVLILLTQFLNLIVGQHPNSDKFWSERVIVGIFQRFGKCALDGSDAHLQGIRKNPTFLTKMVQLFLQMINLKLKPKVLAQFLSERDPFKFEFMVEDIESLEPKVKYMHIVDFISGVMLQEQAERRQAAGDDIRTIARLRQLAGERFQYAEKTMPLHNETCRRSDVIKILNNEYQERVAASQNQASTPSKCRFF